MISSSPFQTDNQKQELFASASEQFPYVCFYRELDSCPEKSISWHWHRAFEIDYVVEGEIEYQTSDEIITVGKGDLLFINSNVLHAASAKNKASGCKLYAHLFDAALLAGTFNSIFEQKYILPVMKNSHLSAVSILKNNAHRNAMEKNFLAAVELCREEPYGYEFEIRSELSHLWILLLREIEHLQLTAVNRNSADIERMKTMLSYIHAHYQEHITLAMIAAAANISTRECTRCFQRCIRTSPVSYLNRYRIQQAAQKLVSTSDSVMTISEACGFSSGSYFGKAFHEIMGCTPKQFRNR